MCYYEINNTTGIRVFSISGTRMTPSSSVNAHSLLVPSGFSFSTFVGILYYARSNIAYLFGNSWKAQTSYKLLALVMLFIGGLATYTFVWDLGDIGVGLMTIFNMIAIIPMSGQAIRSLKDYTELSAQK